MDEYHRHIKYLNKIYKPNKCSFTSIIALLQSTATIRRNWIFEENPPVNANFVSIQVAHHTSVL